jgi:VanZ family protein
MVLMMGIIFLFSSCNATISSLQSNMIVNFLHDLIPVNSFIVRKLAHFSLFSILATSIYLFSKSYILSLSLSSLYAIFDEFHQYFVPGRSCELRDVLIDISGVVIALIIIKLVEVLK